jgi:hypothetical protein
MGSREQIYQNEDAEQLETYRRIMERTRLERAADRAYKATEDLPIDRIGAVTAIALISTGAHAAPALANDIIQSPHNVSPAAAILHQTAQDVSPQIENLVINPHTKKLSAIPHSAESHAETEDVDPGFVSFTAPHDTAKTDGYKVVEISLGKSDDLWLEQVKAMMTTHPSEAEILSAVKKDESLSGIDALAKELGITVEAEAQNLPIGFKASIEIPNRSSEISSLSAESTKVTIPSVSGRETVTVDPGDCLGEIALKNNETLPQLLKANPEYEANPNFVEVGAKIIVEGNSDTAKVASSSKTTFTKIAPKASKPSGLKHNTKKATTGSTTTVASGTGGASISSGSTTSTEAPTTTATATTASTPTASAPISSGATEKTPVTTHFTGNLPTIPKVGLNKKELNALASKISHTAKHHVVSSYLNRLHSLKHTAPRKIHFSKEFCENNLVPGSLEVQEFYYMVACEGLNKSQAAGEEGNVDVESAGTFSTTIVQGGGSSSTPTSAPGVGWGFVQYTPGNKAYDIKARYHVKGPLDSTLTELNMVRMQMHGTSPTNNWDMYRSMKATHTPGQAAEVFEQDFEEGPIAAEGGGDLAGRQNDAKEIYAQFKDSHPIRAYEQLLKESRIYTFEKDHKRKEHEDHTGHKTTGHAAPAPNPVNSTTEHKHKFTQHKTHKATTHAGKDFVGWRLSGEHSMKDYDQCDPEWASLPYGNPGQSDICDSDCGGTSFTMINNTLGNNPMTVAEEAQRYGPEFHTDGTSWSFFPVAAEQNGLREVNLGKNMHMARKILQEGGLIEAAFGVGHFTTEGHFMVIRAETKGGNFYIANPANAGAIALGRGDTNHIEYNWQYLLNPSEGNMQNMWGFLPGSSSAGLIPIVHNPTAGHTDHGSTAKAPSAPTSHQSGHHDSEHKSRHHEAHQRVHVDKHIHMHIGRVAHRTLQVRTAAPQPKHVERLRDVHHAQSHPKPTVPPVQTKHIGAAGAAPSHHANKPAPTAQPQPKHNQPAMAGGHSSHKH